MSIIIIAMAFMGMIGTIVQIDQTVPRDQTVRRGRKIRSINHPQDPRPRRPHCLRLVRQFLHGPAEDVVEAEVGDSLSSPQMSVSFSKKIGRAQVCSLLFLPWAPCCASRLCRLSAGDFVSKAVIRHTHSNHKASDIAANGQIPMAHILKNAELRIFASDFPRGEFC